MYTGVALLIIFVTLLISGAIAGIITFILKKNFKVERGTLSFIVSSLIVFMIILSIAFGGPVDALKMLYYVIAHL
jgi:flagellar biosynthesis protein FliQ